MGACLCIYNNIKNQAMENPNQSIENELLVPILQITNNGVENPMVMVMVMAVEGYRIENTTAMAMPFFGQNPENKQIGTDATHVNISIQDFQTMLMDSSILWFDYPAIKYLANKGVSVDYKSAWEHSPLHLIAVFPDDKLVIMLAGLGAHVNVRDCQDNTPLHLANMNNNVSTIKLLDRLGAYKFIQNDDGKIPEELQPGLSYCQKG